MSEQHALLLGMAVLFPLAVAWYFFTRKPKTDLNFLAGGIQYVAASALNDPQDYTVAEVGGINVIPHSEWKKKLEDYKQGRINLDDFVEQFSGAIIGPEEKPKLPAIDTSLMQRFKLSDYPSGYWRPWDSLGTSCIYAGTGSLIHDVSSANWSYGVGTSV